MVILIVLLSLLALAAFAGYTGRGVVDSRDPDFSLFRSQRPAPRSNPRLP